MERSFTMDPGRLLCRQMGPNAELIMERPGTGLYRGYALGQGGGKVDLGLLIPQGGCLRLCRTLPVETLRRQGCWPITGGTAEPAYDRTAQTLPKGWRRIDSPASRFPKDEPLARTAPPTALLCPREDGSFRLAMPWDPRAPFPFLPAFCLSRVRQLNGKPHILLDFTADGRPVLPEG